jgi:predicted MPP superfamily phosphohydrolase
LLPYLQVQLGYVAGSAALVLTAERLARSRPALARSPRRRLLAVAAALASLLGAWAFAVRALDHPHSTYQFASVALGFYALVLWLPALALAAAARRPRDPWLAAAALALVAVGQYSLWIEPRRIVTRTHEIALEAWAGAEALRVVHVSDLQTVGTRARERDAARIVNGLRPDLIVVTGDYVAGPYFDPEPAIAAARAFFDALERPKHGIVCVPGHSESERVRARVLDGLGVVYLANREIELDVGAGRRLRIFGARTLEHGFDLGGLAARREPGLVTLVASHEPDVSWELEGRGVDLHLAGHTHGGQVAIPGFGPPMTLSSLPRRYARGLHPFGDHLLHVNAGIGVEGNHAPPIRFACPPQIDLLLLAGGGKPRERAPVPTRGRKAARTGS